MDLRPPSPVALLSIALLASAPFSNTTSATENPKPTIGPPPTDKVAIIEKALKAEPTNPQIHLEYGQALWWRGQPLVEAHQINAAGEFVREAQYHLQHVIELTRNHPPGSATQRSQAFYLLSQISAALDSDTKDAEWLLRQAIQADPHNKQAQIAYAPFDQGDRPIVRTARADVKSTTIGSRGLPETQSEETTTENPANAASPEPPLDLSETNEEGMPKSILFNGVVMNLAHEARDVVGPIWAYVPELQDINNWTEMEVLRRHNQFQDPLALAEQTGEYAFQRGGTIINMSGVDGSGRLVFITHADNEQKSEVNVLYTFAKDKTLFAKHYARRFSGPSHKEDSIRAAKANGNTWLEHLALQKVNIAN
ncbi:MAG: hypothetical protein AAGD22_16755 [Verrucomicrobiota bacterium]